MQRCAVWASEQGQHAPTTLLRAWSSPPEADRSCLLPLAPYESTRARGRAPRFSRFWGGNAFFRLGSFVQKVPGEISHEIHLDVPLCPVREGRTMETKGERGVGNFFVALVTLSLPPLRRALRFGA